MIDYDFYISSFRGDAIPAEDWNTCEARSAAQLARYKRIYTVKAPEEYTEELSAGGEAALYWSKGYQTRAQMKDAKKFTDSFEVSESGYYTVMLGTPNRDAYLIYLYVQ